MNEHINGRKYRFRLVNEAMKGHNYEWISLKYCDVKRTRVNMFYYEGCNQSFIIT